MLVTRFERSEQDEVRQLVVDGLAERWGVADMSLNPDLDDLAALDARGILLVGRDRPEGPILGTGTLLRHDPATGEIVRMSVVRDRRGEGIGRLILDALVEHAESLGLQRIVLETTATWTDAMRFYTANGFVPTHTADGPFGPEAHFARVVGRGVS